MILAIDLGQKKSGLAISAGSFASPYKTIVHKNLEEAAESILKIIGEEGVKTVIIGYVEGKTQKVFEDFANRLKAKKPELEIIMWDETLTTRQARDYMIKLQVPKMSKKNKEHQIAASIILQSYLERSEK